MHNKEDEVIALDAKCPDTPDMFKPLCALCGVVSALPVMPPIEEFNPED